MLTEKQIVDCLCKAGCIGTVKMSFDSGPYEITRSSMNADKFARAIEAEVRKEIGAAHQQAIAAAVLVEREAIAQWYAIDGWLMDESDIAGAIRARTQPAPTGAKKEDGHDRTT